MILAILLLTLFSLIGVLGYLVYGYDKQNREYESLLNIYRYQLSQKTDEIPSCHQNGDSP
jgi:hypothetical protein